MDPLSWLGLRKQQDEHPSLQAIHAAVAGVLPDDEPVVVRYIVIVAALLTRVAQADGVFLQCELDHLRELFRHVDRLAPDGVDQVCGVLNERVPQMTLDEWQLCFRELKSLCDAGERRHVLRLLTEQAISDGGLAAQEHSALAEVARELGIDDDGLRALESEILAQQESSAESGANS